MGNGKFDKREDDSVKFDKGNNNNNIRTEDIEKVKQNSYITGSLFEYTNNDDVVTHTSLKKIENHKQKMLLLSCPSVFPQTTPLDSEITINRNDEDKYLEDDFEENKGEDLIEKKSNGAYEKNSEGSNQENINGNEFINNNGKGIDYY